MIYGFTGHRPPKLGGYGKEAQQKLYNFANRTVMRWFDPFKPGEQVIVGMAQGWDMAVAQVCAVRNFRYTAAVPYPGQELVWPNLDTRTIYKSLLQSAERVVYINESTGGNAARALQLRNQWIVDHSDKLVALWDSVESGGTYNCVKYAGFKKVEIINVWKDWEEFK